MRQIAPRPRPRSRLVVHDTSWDRFRAFGLSILLLLCGHQAGLLGQPRVVPGLDRLVRDASSGDDPLSTLVSSWESKGIGIITNHTGRSLSGEPILTVFRERLGLDVVALFSPEHGFEGDAAAGSRVGDRTASGTPVYSLYGESRRPTPQMLDGVDVLVFDMQDVGARFYTYASTMKYAIEESSARGIEFVVLDRPNPLGGSSVSGPIMEPELASFVGIEGLPVVHGMTLGELARWFASEAPELADSSIKLTVVSMDGWDRSMRWPDTGLPWRASSPNLRSFEAVSVYPGAALVEGTNVSEGRGVDTTFQSIGAPWIDGDALAQAMNGLGLNGVSFLAVDFVPRSIPAAPSPKYEDETCYGVAIVVEDPAVFDSVRTGLELIHTLRRLYPEEFRFLPPRAPSQRFYFDLLVGNESVRGRIQRGESLAPAHQAHAEAAIDFLRRRRSALLY